MAAGTVVQLATIASSRVKTGKGNNVLKSDEPSQRATTADMCIAPWTRGRRRGAFASYERKWLVTELISLAEKLWDQHVDWSLYS